MLMSIRNAVAISTWHAQSWRWDASVEWGGCRVVVIGLNGGGSRRIVPYFTTYLCAHGARKGPG